MSLVSIGDLASSYWMRTQNTRLKGDIETLVAELASGETTDVAKTVNGNFRTVSSLEHDLSFLTQLTSSATEAAQFADGLQVALADIQTAVTDTATDLLAAWQSGSSFQLRLTGEQAEQAFNTAVNRLNSQAAGRAMFAGVATDQAAMADPEIILAELDLLVAAETTVSGVQSALDTWFSPGGGYETIAYLGSTTDLASMQIGRHQTVDLSVSAQDVEIRDALKALAMGALIGRGSVGHLGAQTSLLAKTSGESLISSSDQLVETMARIGSRQETIENTSVELSSELAALELARSSLLSVDPYDRATQLQDVESRLEMLYAMTARSSRLKLTDYL